MCHLHIEVGNGNCYLKIKTHHSLMCVLNSMTSHVTQKKMFFLYTSQSIGFSVVLDPTNFHCMKINSQKKLQNVLLCVPQRKESHTGLDPREGE